MVRSVQIGTADPNTMRTHAANAPRAIRFAFRDRAQGRAIGRPRLSPPQLKLAFRASARVPNGTVKWAARTTVSGNRSSVHTSLSSRMLHEAHRQGLRQIILAL